MAACSYVASRLVTIALSSMWRQLGNFFLISLQVVFDLYLCVHIYLVLPQVTL